VTGGHQPVPIQIHIPLLVMPLQYRKGDAIIAVTNEATQQQTTMLIIHNCNNAGIWTQGFSASISQTWYLPKDVYKRTIHYELGTTQFVTVTTNIVVANMISQNGVNSFGYHKQRIDYDALRKCLKEVYTYAVSNDVASVHMSRIGTRSGCGNWGIIESIIKDELCGIDTFVYDLY